MEEFVMKWELYQEDGIIVEPAGCLSVCGLDLGDIEGKILYA